MKLTYRGKRYVMYMVSFAVSVLLAFSIEHFPPAVEIEQFFRKPFYNVMFSNDRSFDIVIIRIDEKTFRELKSDPALIKYKDAIWPLPPCIYGELLDRIAGYGAVCVGFDIIFDSFHNVFLPWYAEYDSFVKAQERNGIPVILGAKRSGGDYILPCKDLQKEGFSTGLINVRRTFFGEIINYQFIQGGHDSLAYALAKSCGREKGIEISGWTQDLLKENQLISFQNQPGKGFPMISLSDVLTGKLPDDLKKYWKVKDLNDLFDGKDVLVAVTLLEHYDFHSSPADSKEGMKLHGVEFHANAAEMLLNYAKLRYTVLRGDFKLLVILAAALISWILLLNLKPFRWVFFSLLVLFCYFIGAIKVFQNTNIFFPVVSVYFCYILFGIISTFLVWSIERKEKNFIKGAFGKYIPETVAKQISDDPDVLKLGGKKMNISVLFCDILGFTGISENMSSERLISFLNTYLDAMTDEIFKTDGTLDKYIGDAIMAFWGAPFECGDHALKACKAAIAMKKRLASWNASNIDFPEISFGIGIHSGESVVGNAGSQKRFDYTAIGDNVNTSSRLEGLTRLYGVSIIISGVTREFVKDTFDLKFLDRVTVKGKQNVTDLYELLSYSGESDREMLELNRKSMDAYLNRDWEAAENFFRTIQEKYKDNHSRIFLERIAEIKSNPVERDSHSGIYELKRK